MKSGLIGELLTEVELSAADVFFGLNSYAKGASVTQEDYNLVKKLKGVPPNEVVYPNLYRWFVHINYLSDEVARTTLKTPSKVSKPTNTCKVQSNKPTKNDNLDDFDVFAADDDEAVPDTKQQTKSNNTPTKPKKQIIAKSSLVIEVTPANDNVNLEHLWKSISNIKINGLTWGESFQKIPLAFSIFKLRCSCTIIDELVETDLILEEIEVLGLSEEKAKQRRAKRDAGDDDDDDDEDEDALVQTAQILSFNKI